MRTAPEGRSSASEGELSGLALPRWGEFAIIPPAVSGRGGENDAHFGHHRLLLCHRRSVRRAAALERLASVCRCGVGGSRRRGVFPAQSPKGRRPHGADPVGGGSRPSVLYRVPGPAGSTDDRSVRGGNAALFRGGDGIRRSHHLRRESHRTVGCRGQGCRVRRRVPPGAGAGSAHQRNGPLAGRRQDPRDQHHHLYRPGRIRPTLSEG